VASWLVRLQVGQLLREALTNRNPKKAKAARKGHQMKSNDTSDVQPSDQLPRQRMRSESSPTPLHNVFRDEPSFGAATFHDVFGDSDDDLKEFGDASKQGKDDSKYE
jgi:hypothetical protein